MCGIFLNHSTVCDWPRKNSKLKVAFFTNHKLVTVLRFAQMLPVWSCLEG